MGAGAVGVRPVLSGEAPRTDALVGLGLAGGGRAFYVPLGHRYLGVPRQLPREQVREALRPLVEGEVEKHAHGLKAAMHAMAGLGLAWHGPGVDTELASRLLLPTRREHALSDVVRERISNDLPRDPSGGDAARKSERVALEGVEVERAAEWCAASAAALPDLARSLLRGMEEEKVLSLYQEVERPLVSVLVEMERAGIAADRGAMSGMSEEFGHAMDELLVRIHAEAGHPFNVASTRELAQVLFEELKLPVVKRLKTGPSTDQDVLEKLAEQHALPRLVLEHRALSKLKSTYVDTLPALIAPDGRIHTTFHQAGAATGRLSSSDPNLQNIPVRTELSRRIRAAFVAPRGPPAGVGGLLADRAAHPGPLLRRPGAGGGLPEPRGRPHPHRRRDLRGGAGAGHRRHAAGGQGAQLRHRLRPLGVRALAAAGPAPGPRRRRSSTATSPATPG